jgi:SnoaL-like domain
MQPASITQEQTRIQHSDRRYGSGSRNRLVQASDPGRDGAWAALETFYFALNNRDAEVLAAVWSQHPLAQLNNPLAGILRGGSVVTELYGRILKGAVKVEVELADIVEYGGKAHALFAGRETGTYTVAGQRPSPLSIRTSRYFRYDSDRGRWQQFHHHGSIDDPLALQAYQRAVLS